MASKKQTGASTRGKVNILKPKKKLLPPDPEECNDDRAAHVDAAIETFSNITSVDRQDVIGDLLASLMHLCDRDPKLGDFEDGLARAYRFYDQETATDEEYMTG